MFDALWVLFYYYTIVCATDSEWQTQISTLSGYEISIKIKVNAVLLNKVKCKHIFF